MSHGEDLDDGVITLGRQISRSPIGIAQGDQFIRLSMSLSRSESTWAL